MCHQNGQFRGDHKVVPPCVSKKQKKTELGLEIVSRGFLRARKPAKREVRSTITMPQQPFAQPTPPELRARLI